jgi:hypothetical protein
MSDNESATTIPVGRVLALLNEYGHLIEAGGEDARVYRRVRDDLRRTIEPEYESGGVEG